MQREGGLSSEGMPCLKAFIFKMFQKHQPAKQTGCAGLSPAQAAYDPDQWNKHTLGISLLYP